MKEKQTHIHARAVTLPRLFVDGLAASAGVKSNTSYITSHTTHSSYEKKKKKVSPRNLLFDRVAGCDAGWWRARGQSERECECEKSGRCRGGEEKPGLFAEAESQIESFILTLPSLPLSLHLSLPSSIRPSSPLRLSRIATATESGGRGGHEGGKEQSQLRRGELMREEDQRCLCLCVCGRKYKRY